MDYLATYLSNVHLLLQNGSELCSYNIVCALYVCWHPNDLYKQNHHNPCLIIVIVLMSILRYLPVKLNLHYTPWINPLPTNGTYMRHELP